jgi:peptidoglycan-N-acetylglucosamine deacetylase
LSENPGILGGVPSALSLTFDDGPDETWTARVLAQLDRCGVAATFFMVGRRVRAHLDTARMVVAGGHDVQLHCHRHVRHTNLSEQHLWADTELALAALEDVGVRPGLWRAPWGVCTDASQRVAHAFGLRLVGWSIDTHDWRGDPPHTMLTHVTPRLVDGGAVLMHDALGPGATRAGCENTIALIPMLTAAAHAHGVALTPMTHREAVAV